MKKFNLLIIFIIICIQSNLYPQDNQFLNKMYGSGKPVFNYEIEKLFLTTKGYFNIGCYIEIENDRLHFTKHDSLYRASYEINIAIFTEENEDIPIIQQKEKVEILADTFSDTESRTISHFNKFDFKLKEGRYQTVIKLKDMASNRIHTVSEQVSYRKTGSLGVTKLIMVDMEKGHETFNLQTIKPLIDSTVDSKTPSIAAFFEVYTESPGNNYTIEYKILTSEDRQIYHTSYARKANEEINKELVLISLENIMVGSYTIELKVKIGDKVFFREHDFYVKYKDISVQVDNIPQSIEQMLYIMEYDSLKKVFEMEETVQKEWFKDFWNTLEQNSGQSENSLMEEYFRRINFANTHFKAYKKPGWRTDMGKVLCVVGEPDEVHSYSFPANNKRPYEIWVYYKKGMQYIFDEIGGEFKLRREFTP